MFFLYPVLPNAKEYTDITNDIEVRYRWYKEIKKGGYYPQKDITSEEFIEINNIKYGEYSDWKEEYCSLSEENYLIEEKTIILYEKVYNGRYIMLENYHGNVKKDIQIYQKNKLIKFDVLNNHDGIIKIDLKNHYQCQYLKFFIWNDTSFQIGIYRDIDFQQEIVSKKIDDERILVPDNTWVTSKTIFIKQYVEKEYEDGDLNKELSRKKVCRYKEKYVYKYVKEKEYYDDNYYLNIEGYIKDLNDYKVFYKGEALTNIIEITNEKIVEIPQIEYIYIEQEPNAQIIDSSNQETCPTTPETNIVEQKVFKIPNNIYILIVLLIVVIILFSIKLYKTMSN